VKFDFNVTDEISISGTVEPAGPGIVLLVPSHARAAVRVERVSSRRHAVEVGYESPEGWVRLAPRAVVTGRGLSAAIRHAWARASDPRSCGSCGRALPQRGSCAAPDCI